MVTRDNYPHIPRPKIQPGGEEHLRNPVPLTTHDEMVPAQMFALALVHLKNEVSKLPTMIEDQSKPVDEYQPSVQLAPESESVITLQPQWETPEIIKTVLITGPPAGVVTLQLGDRTWPLVIGVSGFINLTHLGVILGRMDNRTLTITVAGQYSLELMGHADSRGNKI